MPHPNHLTLSQFTNLLKSLQLSGYVNLSQLTSMSEDAGRQIYGDQPGINAAIARLDLALRDKEFSFLDSKKEFHTLIQELVLVARRDSTPSKNKITQQAAYLAGFLLHHDFKIQLGEELKNINEVISEYLPRQRFLKKGDKLPPIANFLNAKWRKQRGYPSIETLSSIWQKHLQELAKEKKQAQQAQQVQQAQQAQQEQHFFDGRTLTLGEFSYVLEALVKTGFVTLPEDYFESRSTDLTVEMAKRMTEFSRNARNDFIDPNIAINQFQALMKYLQFTAGSRKSLKSLYGFLLHHDFQIGCSAGTIKMSNTIGNDSVAQAWRAVEGMPGRIDLERALQGNQNYLPSFRRGPRAGMEIDYLSNKKETEIVRRRSPTNLRVS